jgi:hypothetical protein
MATRADVARTDLESTPQTTLAFRCLAIEAFAAEVAAFAWRRRIWRIDMHHTFIPDHARWRELGSAGCCAAMRHHHVEGRGFEDIAQHVTIAPDGTIWTGRDWNRTPASVGFGMNAGVFMFEMIGNFDIGHDVLEGAQLDATVAVIDIVQRRFALPVHALLFHREVPQTDKTCPGSGVLKGEILDRVRHQRRHANIART